MGAALRCFNHESPRRGETFVTRKITRAAARIKTGLQSKLYLGNLNSERDWGFAGDYVRMMWIMLQQDNPDDSVAATGVKHAVRDFVNFAFSELGITLDWSGEGINEKGVDVSTGKTLVEVDPRYFRPAEVELLIGDSSKAKERLGWEPEVSLKELVSMMVENDLKEAEKELHLKNGGYEVKNYYE